MLDGDREVHAFGFRGDSEDEGAPKGVDDTCPPSPSHALEKVPQLDELVEGGQTVVEMPIYGLAGPRIERAGRELLRKRQPRA